MEEKSLVACGTPSSSRNESVLVIEQFLTDNYLFRRNVLNGKVELGRVLVSLNYEATDKADAAVGEGDVISLRGAGKGKVTGFGGNSRKGRLYVYTEIYR